MKNKKGFAAILSVLVIAAVALVIAVTLTLTSISEAQLSLSEKKKEDALDFVESCVEDTLLYLNNENDLPTVVTLPDGTCTVTLDDKSGNDWTFTVEGTLEGYTKEIQVEAERSGTVTITSWKEL